MSLPSNRRSIVMKATAFALFGVVLLSAGCYVPGPKVSKTVTLNSSLPPRTMGRQRAFPFSPYRISTLSPGRRNPELTIT